MATQPIETLTTEQQTTFRNEIGAQQANANLTAYATAGNDSVRRALFNASPKTEISGIADLSVPPSSGEVGALRIIPDAAPGEQLCYWNGTEWLSVSTGATPLAGL